MPIEIIKALDAPKANYAGYSKLLCKFIGTSKTVSTGFSLIDAIAVQYEPISGSKSRFTFGIFIRESANTEDKNSVLIPQRTLATLIDMSNSHYEDIVEGLNDGTYDKADNQDLDEKLGAITIAQHIASLAAKPEPVTEQPSVSGSDPLAKAISALALALANGPENHYDISRYQSAHHMLTELRQALIKYDLRLNVRGKSPDGQDYNALWSLLSSTADTNLRPNALQIVSRTN